MWQAKADMAYVTTYQTWSSLPQIVHHCCHQQQQQSVFAGLSLSLLDNAAVLQSLTPATQCHHSCKTS